MRLKLATSLKNKTSSLARDPRLLNSVVDTKGRVQKRPSLVASFGPVTVGNGLGLFVRNTPIGTTGGTQELISITGGILTTNPGIFINANYTLTAVDGAPGSFGFFFGGPGSISPTLLNGQTIQAFFSETGGTWFRTTGTDPNLFTSITANGITLLTADAAFAGNSWNWTPTEMFSSAGTYGVLIV